jgi:ornithine--oxo-acid transaminase
MVKKTMLNSTEIMQVTDQLGAPNYHPLPIVITKAQGVWVEDPEGNRYMDMLSSYSALNQGHRHPKIIQALKDQADRVTLTSRAFYNDQLCRLFSKLQQVSKKAMFLPMNTGAEAVETAIKAVRRWGYRVKGIPLNQAEIIVCTGNFHGRTLTITSFSSEQENKDDFGPFTPGFILVPYGDLEALEKAITPNTAAFLAEPIQGEAGIIIPPDGFLQKAYQICKNNKVLFVADEIQTGFGRTGQWFACDWENVIPDMYIFGKALGGGVLPISAIAADQEILSLFNPGSHGSTFGGNPLACAVAVAAIEVLEEEKLIDNSLETGNYFLEKLRQIDSPVIREIRGKGLFIGVELTSPARPYCEQLKKNGLLCKETHEKTLRFAPPLTITRQEVDWALERLIACFAK